MLLLQMILVVLLGFCVEITFGTSKKSKIIINQSNAMTEAEFKSREPCKFFILKACCRIFEKKRQGKGLLNEWIESMHHIYLSQVPRRAS